MLKRLTVCLLAAGLLLSLTGCFGTTRAPETVRPDLSAPFLGRQYAYAYASSESPSVTLSKEGAAAVLEVVNGQTAVFPYAHLYQLEEVEKRLAFDAAVEYHARCALNDAGVLDAAHLTRLVQENNAAYLKDYTFGVQELDPGYLTDICDLIVSTVTQMQTAYPDMDWDRVYCNLGNLKILYKTGMLDFAQVDAELLLAVNNSTTKIAQTLKGERAFRNILVHETMHILQIGCLCEDIENASRRCGISVYWKDFPMNTADFGWLFEGSAERVMSTLTGDGATTYQYKVDYLCSYTMSVVLRDRVEADTLETLHFYDDPQKLFDTFGCETAQERQELLKAVITTNILQMQPQPFMEAYENETGVDLTKDNDALNEFCYQLKPSVCITLAKEFFSNLVPFIRENDLSCDDLLFLLHLFEGQMNQHLVLTNENRAAINQPFTESYLAMRNALFENLDTPENLQGLYEAYRFADTESKTLNARLTCLPESKRLFFAERAQWLADMDATSLKIY